VSEELARELEGMGILDAQVLRAMAEVPRRLFVPEQLQGRADGDHPLPIGFGQTISQPYMVAWMTQALELTGEEKVLEIGTGSGYQAAILSRVCEQVFTIELVPELAERARETLARLGFGNVLVRQGDGSAGWPEEAPFDGILVTAAALRTPPALLGQLRPGGRMVIPIGAPHDVQYVHVLRKDGQGAVLDRELFAVRFVPLRGGEDSIAVEWP
jgi:protein-L-isoaspartate(D-aspartate) O-methyltransferase